MVKRSKINSFLQHKKINKTSGKFLTMKREVVKCTCLLKDMDHFREMNAVYAEYFDEDPPARAAYQVVRLPLDVLIEIEAIAMK